MSLSETQFEKTNTNSFKQFLPLFIKIGAGLLVIAAIITGVYYAINVLAPESEVDGNKWVPDYSVVIGDRNSNVKVIEFADLQCPACKDNHPKFNNLKDQYQDRAAFVYRHFPLTSIHPFAPEAANGAQAAARQGADLYVKYVDEVYAIQNDISNDTIEQSAVNAGLDIDQWRRDKNSSSTKNEVAADEEFITSQTLPESVLNGSTKASGTPTIVIVKDDKAVSWWSGSQDEEFQASELLKYLEE